MRHPDAEVGSDPDPRNHDWEGERYDDVALELALSPIGLPMMSPSGTNAKSTDVRSHVGFRGQTGNVSNPD